MRKTIAALALLSVLIGGTSGCKPEVADNKESEVQESNETIESITSEATAEPEILENDGDIEIVIPDDQESGGE